MNINFRKIDKQTKKVLAQDRSLLVFWSRYFLNKNETSFFVQTCLKKITTRRMMLRVKWYVDIANKMPKVKDNRPALQVVFLVALAENIARKRSTKKQADKLGSQKLVLDFSNTS